MKADGDIRVSKEATFSFYAVLNHITDNQNSFRDFTTLNTSVPEQKQRS